MKRRAFLAGLAIPAMPQFSTAQPPGKVPRLGILRWGTYPDDSSRVGLREALNTFGYREGHNITIEWRATTSNDLADRHAAEFVQLGVDVIVVNATPAAHAAQKATRSVPIVLAGIADPVGSGLVASLARPGGNITGVSWNLPALAGKRLELLKEALPGVSRVAYLASSRDPAARQFVEHTQIAAQHFGVRLQVVSIKDADEFGAAFGAMEREGAQTLIVQPLFTTGHTQALTDLAGKHRLPLIADFRSFAQAGALMAFGPADRARWQRTASFVDRILRGAKPGDLPVEEPAEFLLVINLKTASTLGITIPQSLLLRADEVIR